MLLRMPPAVRSIFAEMTWLDERRARAWLRVLAATSCGFALIVLLASPAGLDPAGRPIGTDFVSFWSAARLVVTGAGPASPYDGRLLGALQTATFHGADVGYTPFPYPPVFLLLCLPLGLLPYFGALAAWLLATGAAYVLVLRRWLGRMKGSLLLLLAYPGVLINAAHGQNGFLTTALFGAGALLLRSRPAWAGVCFGALIFKPHLGLLIPAALIGARSRRAFASAAATALGLVAASTAVLGLSPWRGFIDASGLMTAVLTEGLLHPGKIQSVFAGLKLLGAPSGFAFALQALVGLGAAASLFVFGRRVGPSPALGAALIAATLITTPYLLSYDLVLAAVPLAWMLAEARKTGFARWEKAALLAAFTLPMLCLVLVQARMPVAPVVLAALYLVVLRRGGRSAAAPCGADAQHSAPPARVRGEFQSA